MWVDSRLEGHFEVIVHPDEPYLIRRSYSRRPEIRARRQALLPDEVTTFHGLPVTTEPRTWIDLADRLTLADLVAAGDSVLRGAHTTADLERAVLLRAGHRRGVVNARAALMYLDARSRSRPESVLRFVIMHGGLPAPAVNEPIFSAVGEWLAEPDLSYADVRLAVEYNGAMHADVERSRCDITRQLDVESRGGWRVVVFGSAEVFRYPDQIPIRIARLRREQKRLPHLGDWPAAG